MDCEAVGVGQDERLEKYADEDDAGGSFGGRPKIDVSDGGVRRLLMFGGGEVRAGIVDWVLVVVLIDGWRSLVEPLASAGESDG